MVSFQLLILPMPGGIPAILFIQVLLKSFRQVNAGLIRQANDYPEYIGQFIAQVFVFVRFLFGLFPVAPGNDAGYFTNLFGQLRHIGQLVEIPNANGLYPVVDGGLGIV